MQFLLLVVHCCIIHPKQNSSWHANDEPTFWFRRQFFPAGLRHKNEKWIGKVK